MAKFLESVEEMMAKIRKALDDPIKARIKKNRPRVRQAIKFNIFNAIYECPEMESLRSGRLKYDFGLDFDPTVAIAEAVSNAFRTTYTKNYVGDYGFVIDIQPTSYLNVLDLPEAVQITENGETLPWLEWLLLYGSTVSVISDYGVKYCEYGRSGGAIMIENYPTGPFMVYSPYSGTQFDNFITRALEKHTPEIISAVWQIVRI